jgi:hypothetical protein
MHFKLLVYNVHKSVIFQKKLVIYHGYIMYISLIKLVYSINKISIFQYEHSIYLV